MKKNLISTVLLITLVAALMVSFTACGAQDPDSNDKIAELEQQNAQLQAQIDQLTAQKDNSTQTSQVPALKDWALDASVWTDNNGATVTFSATPVSYAEGQKAALSVRMGELEAESTNCVWNGSAFTGSVELSAADGYSYYCIITSPEGIQEEIELTSPANPTHDLLVHLGTNLAAYANLVVEEWSADSTVLTIRSGYIQAQMPKMTGDGSAPTASKAELVLKLSGETVSRQEVTLEAGEGPGSYAATLSNCTFAMPAMADDHQLDLWLEVTLNTGSTVSVAGCSWYNSDGSLQMVVG